MQCSGQMQFALPYRHTRERWSLLAEPILSIIQRIRNLFGIRRCTCTVCIASMRLHYEWVCLWWLHIGRKSRIRHDQKKITKCLLALLSISFSWSRRLNDLVQKEKWKCNGVIFQVTSLIFVKSQCLCQVRSN